MRFHFQSSLLFFFCFTQVSATGSVLRSEILGCIKLKVVLSGMPELRLGLNDKVLFEITGSECTYLLTLFKSLTLLSFPPVAILGQNIKDYVACSFFVYFPFI